MGLPPSMGSPAVFALEAGTGAPALPTRPRLLPTRPRLMDGATGWGPEEKSLPRGPAPRSGLVPLA